MSERETAGTTAQSYGLLATRLNESFRRAREALEPHTNAVPGATLAGLDALLEEFARRRVRIALYGEVKAGKSTLLNALAGGVLSPVAFDPLTSVPVRVTYGDTIAWRVGNRSLDSVDELARLMRDGGCDAAEVVVETNLDLLHLGGQVDVLDTPGVGSADEFDAVTAEVLGSLDAVVLVVRYPALFTQFTRHLMDGLQADMGKLFVVWNLDTACAEITAEERSRHAQTLRDNVAGAHELFLVDARAALEAALRGDSAAVAASGLAEFSEALSHFASSDAREVAALREAAKRAHRWLGAAERALTERRAQVEREVAAARARIREVESRAAAEDAAERGRHASVAAAVKRIAEQSTATWAEAAADARRELRAARRRWIRRGDIGGLEAGVATVVARYADAVESATRATSDLIYGAAAEYGSKIDVTPRTRVEPEVSELSPVERSRRALEGRWQMLRRALWRRWYLPGLAALERAGIAGELAAQAAWLGSAVAAAEKAAGDTLAGRLSVLEKRAQEEAERIRQERNLAANERELTQLLEHVPVVAAQVAAIDGLLVRSLPR